MNRIFTGGTILTMADDKQVEAVYVEDNIIKAKGSLEDCKKVARWYEIVDLKGKCMTPGFVDTHTHPMMIGMCRIWADLDFPKVACIDDFVRVLKEHAETIPDMGLIRECLRKKFTQRPKIWIGCLPTDLYRSCMPAVIVM